MHCGARPYNRWELQAHIELILKLHHLQDPKDREFIRRLQAYIPECDRDTIYFTKEEEERFHYIMCVTSDAENWHTDPDCANERGRAFIPDQHWGPYPHNWWMITSDTAH